jgi:ATP-dependent helicase/nuclease subunit B
VISNVRRYSEGMEIAGFWKDACAWYGKNDVEKYNIIESGLGYKNTAEQLGRDSLDKIYGDTVSMTVSKLESFAACPFKYFIENIVKPDPRIVQKIESFDLGNIYHRAIEEFTNELNEMLKTMNIESLGEEDILEMAGRHTESSWNEYSEFNSALEANSRNKYMKKKVDRVSKRAACAIVRQLKKGNFRPAFTELEIGMSDGEGGEAKLEPVELKLGGSRTAKLRGRIDRVDTFEKDGKKYVNIIDYKSSNYAKDILLPDAAEGIQTQLFVYMKSILENGESLFGGEKPEIGGLYYFHINDPMVDADAPVSARTEDDVFGKLAMKGYILDDETIIKNMDKKIEKTSDVIPVSYKEDGTYSSKTRKLSREQFDSMIKEVESKSIENTNRILDGDIEIKPYLKDAGGFTPCSYCDYISVCQFDKDSGNEYKRIPAMSDEDVLNKISEKGGDKDGMDEGTKENN